MMSHLDPRKGGGRSGAVCLRSQNDRPQQIIDHLKETGLSSSIENWCAAHLNMLCASAEKAFDKYSVYENDPSRQRGMLINYASLPGAVPNYLLPMFGVQVTGIWLETMARESTMYSKSRGAKVKPFTGDSADKEQHATEEINRSAKVLMDPLYKRMDRKAAAAAKKFRPDVYSLIAPTAVDTPDAGAEPKWSAIKTIPTADSAPLATKVVGHKNKF